MIILQRQRMFDAIETQKTDFRCDNGYARRSRRLPFSSTISPIKWNRLR